MRPLPIAMVNPESRLPLLDSLRGVAALSVAWFHFTKNNPALGEQSLLRESGTYAWLGVEVFFVISGFVIPLALSRSSYRLRDFGRFMLRRMVRLDPPYLAAIAITVMLGYLSAAAPGYRGVPYHVTLPQLALHFAFVNVFFGYPWINEVFWTLAIEFQFYLLLGLFFPLLSSRNQIARYATMSVFAAMAFVIPAEAYVFRYAFLFLLGIVTYQRHAGLIGTRAYTVVAGAAFIGAIFTPGPAYAIAAVSTAVLIATVRRGTTLLGFFGAISYPLYLLHGPVGGRIINLAARFEAGRAVPLLVIIAAFAAAIAISYLIHITIEVPSRRWASRIRYPRAIVQPVESPSL